MAISPSAQQLYAISITERICSAISLVGTFVIVITFMGSRSFRKSINRLVFYASWGNMMANIATLISQDGIHFGVGSSLCQFQAFMIQWFMPADAMWTFAMACNVYLTFFHKYNSEQLRCLEWKYVLCCYGLPLIPACVFCFINTPARGRVYGSAILWCWISLPWDYLRIAVFYVPVWVVIFLTFAIYLRAGSVIYQKHRQLQIVGAMESTDSDLQHDFPPRTLSGIQVTREIACSSPISESLSMSKSHPTRNSTMSSFSPYSVVIEGGCSNSETNSQPLSLGSSSAPQVGVYSKIIRSHRRDSLVRKKSLLESNSASWIYTKYAMLFFIALLVTWVPSTANRVYALVHPDEFSFGLNYVSSFVLPLQGFWNSLIYVSISWSAFKALGAELQYRASNLRELFKHEVRVNW